MSTLDFHQQSAGSADDELPKGLSQQGELGNLIVRGSEHPHKRFPELQRRPSDATLGGARTPSPPLLRDADDCRSEGERLPSGLQTPPTFGARASQVRPPLRGDTDWHRSRKSKGGQVLQFFHAADSIAAPSQAGSRSYPPPPVPWQPPGLSASPATPSAQFGPPEPKGVAQPVPLDPHSTPQGGADLDVDGQTVEWPLSGERTPWLSAGSVGHPHSCKTACRYIKRKGGCRVSASCPHCHLCFWRRDAEADGVAKSSLSGKPVTSRTDVISVGSQGHPDTCGAPCRYARRKDGCRNGRDCTNCHICLWRRDAMPSAQPSFFGEAGQTLETMIRSLLQNRESDLESAGSASLAGAVAAAASVPDRAGSDEPPRFPGGRCTKGIPLSEEEQQRRSEPLSDQ